MRHSLHVDIPLLLRFTSAKRHDSVSFLVAFHEFEKHMPDLHISNMCLDSAMDNYPTYKRTLSPIAFVSALIQEGCLPSLIMRDEVFLYMMPGSKGLNPHELAHKWMKDLGARPNMSLKVG